MAYDDDWYPHQDLKPILKDTYGVIVYQEQVIDIIKLLANYSPGKADMFRRAIGRKDKELMDKILPQFTTDCVNNGYSEELSIQIAEYIDGCSDYLFNKAHSVAYGYIAMQTAYLKANYPLEFICSQINYVTGEQDKVALYIDYCRQNMITLHQPNLIKGTNKTSIVDGHIIMGFNTISGIGKTNVPTGISNFYGFCSKNSALNKKVTGGLIKAGCFDGDRNLMLSQLEWYKDKRKSKPAIESILATTNISDSDMEIEVFGYDFSNKMKSYDLEIANDTTVLGCVITSIKPWKTKKGDPMAFIKARTTNGIKDLVIFNDAYLCMNIGSVYLIKVDGNRVKDFCLAKETGV